MTPASTLTTGIDLVEIERMQGVIDRHGDHFLRRVFTPKELAEVGDNPASLSARFAAKEAVTKALGTGIGRVTWHEIEILRGPEHKPRLLLHGSAEKLSAESGFHNWSISLSHTHRYAVAVAVALGGNN